MQEELAHEGFFVANGRERHQAVLLVELGQVILARKPVAHFLRQVGHVAGQLDVFVKAVVIIDALFLVEAQPMVKHMGFEGVVDGIQRVDESPKPVKVCLARRRVGLQVRLVLRRQPGEVGVAEGNLVSEAGILAHQIIQLGQRQPFVDFKAAEPAAVAELQVFEDQVNEAGEVGTLEARQEVAALVARDGLARGQLQAGVFDLLQVARLHRQGAFEERLRADEGAVQLRRGAAVVLTGLARMVEVQVQLLAQVLEGFRRVLVVIEQRLAVEQLARAVHHLPVPVPYPAVDDLPEPFSLADVLGLQRLEVIIVVRPWHQLLEGGLAISGQAERLDVSDLLGGEAGREQREGAGQPMQFACHFHNNGCGCRAVFPTPVISGMVIF